MRVGLGDKVKDTISGLVGIAVARTEWLHGCLRITIQPAMGTDGKVPENYTVDEPQCEVLEVGAVRNDPFWRQGEAKAKAPELPEALRTHGDRQNIPRGQEVRR